jgi:hypothetical protein
MLKLKVHPAMCMKTQERITLCAVKRLGLTQDSARSVLAGVAKGHVKPRTLREQLGRFFLTVPEEKH